MGAIEVSVVIPTYNRSGILRDMLEALSRQTLPPASFKVLVVVDGSTDGTWEMLRALEMPYRLRLLYQENAGLGSGVFSSGVSVARNRGADLAEGRVVLFLDDDLLPVPELLDEHAQVHRKDKHAVVLGRLLPTDKSASKRGWNLWEERILEKHYRLMASGERPPAGWRLYSSNFSVSLELFRQLDGFDLAMGHIRGEDVELGFRLEDAGARFYFAPAAAAVHRGYRSFPSWCNSAYILGVRDVVLAKEKGHPQLLQRISGSYRRKPVAVQWAVACSVGRRRVQDALVHATKAGAGALSWLGFRRLAHMGYSVIFNLCYWHGVSDELGGRHSFRRSLAGETPAGVSMSGHTDSRI